MPAAIPPRQPQDPSDYRGVADHLVAEINEREGELAGMGERIETLKREIAMRKDVLLQLVKLLQREGVLPGEAPSSAPDGAVPLEGALDEILTTASTQQHPLRSGDVWERLRREYPDNFGKVSVAVVRTTLSRKSKRRGWRHQRIGPSIWWWKESVWGGPTG